MNKLIPEETIKKIALRRFKQLSDYKTKRLSAYKFVNEKVERALTRFWIHSSQRERNNFLKTLKLIPINSMQDGIFGRI
jgi:hypothetical protein